MDSRRLLEVLAALTTIVAAMVTIVPAADDFLTPENETKIRATDAPETTNAVETLETTTETEATTATNAASGATGTDNAETNCDVGATEQSLDEGDMSYDEGASSKVNASILSFVPERGTFEPGDVQCARVTAENTGATREDFFVGYSTRGPDGEGYHDEGPTEPKVTLAPGESETVIVEWTVTSSAPTGEYGAGTKIWRDLDEGTDDLDGPIVSTSETDVSEVVNETA